MPLPVISAVIPAYEQAPVLAITLASFEMQRPHVPFEVIVVDDGSQDDTARVAQAGRSFPLRCLRIRHAGRAAARNAGARAARAPVVLFCDADRPVAATFVAAHARRHAAPAAPCAVVGAIREWYFADAAAHREAILADVAVDFAHLRPLAREPSYARTVSRMFGSDGHTDYGVPWLAFLSGNVSVSRAALDAVGGFDPQFLDWGLEHLECGYRLHRGGVPFIHERAAVNYHIAHRREAGFYERHLRSSLTYWAGKHGADGARRLEAFLSGRLSLQQYHAAVTGAAAPNHESPPIYYRQFAASPVKRPADRDFGEGCHDNRLQ